MRQKRKGIHSGGLGGKDYLEGVGEIDKITKIYHMKITIFNKNE